MFDETVRESVKAHLNADVPVGSFLSGGIDSSYITATLMLTRLFRSDSMSPNDTKFNETDYAAELSGILGIENYRKMLTADECFEAFPDIIYHMDEPQSIPPAFRSGFLPSLRGNRSPSRFPAKARMRFMQVTSGTTRLR